MGLTLLLDESMQRAEDYGGQAFGQQFRMVGNPTFSRAPGGIELIGDLDVVVPFAGGKSQAAQGLSGSALFLQQGVTRWLDSTGAARTDFRYGFAYRFRVPGKPDAGILGLSLLQLHNAERQHKVLVPTIDYSGKRVNGSLRYFIPTTGWRSSLSGREERAIEGVELAAGLDITSTLRAKATGYRWEAADGSGRWNHGVRLGLGWRPHTWLNLAAGYDGYSGAEGSLSFRIMAKVPLGGPSNPPRWEGLGVAAGGSAPGDSELWRPIEGDSRIRTASRENASSLVSGAEVRFLQDSIESGGAVQLEVVLPAAAPEDIRIEVRLVPGSGDNPAVPGEDFVDEPIVVTIPAGAASSRVSVQLLRNGSQQENRSLSATVSLIS